MAFDPTRDALVFEGRWDALGCIELLRRRQVRVPDPKRGNTGISFERGIDTAIARFAQLVEVADRGSRVGLVIDLDAPSQGNPGSVAKLEPRLAELFGTLPGVLPSPAGFGPFPTSNGVSAGIWLMPDNTRFGAFEDFLRDLGPGPNLAAVEAWAKGATAQAETIHGAPFQPHQRAKAEFRTYLAWQNPPDGHYGQAIANGAFDARSPAADPFLAWFDRMFGS